MKIFPHPRLLLIIILTIILSNGADFPTAQAQSLDTWWHDDWPYRVPVQLDQNGIAALNLDFSQLFSNLGLNEALLDLRSLRVIPYKDGHPGLPVPYQETYSTLFIDANSLNLDNNSSPYWFGEEDTTFTLDDSRFTTPPAAIHTHTTINQHSSIESGFSYHFKDTPHADWSGYEVLIFDIWPEVNDSAVDQTPDLFQLKLEGIAECPFKYVGGPALAMDRWNRVSISLKPFGNCAAPNLSGVHSMRMYTIVNRDYDNNGNYDPGDELELWLDNFRLVDQDGDGQIRWLAQEGVDRYYIYFDTLNHEGHPPPEMTSLPEPTVTAGNGGAQAGGYFHMINGTKSGSLTIWRSPLTEKVLPTYKAPIETKPLVIKAARGEFEPIQLVVRSPITQSLPVSLSDLKHQNGKDVIPASHGDIFRVDYLEIEHLSDFYGRLGPWPDPLYPISLNQKIKFLRGVNQPLWFRFKVPDDAEPGLYASTINIGAQTVPFTLEVWHFNLPETSVFTTKIGFDWEAVTMAYSGSGETIDESCLVNLTDAINKTLEAYHLTPIDPTDSNEYKGSSVYTLTNYEINKAQDYQGSTGDSLWWEFAARDFPPLTNPGVIDRSGSEARILPWMAWLSRVDALFYRQATDWDGDPWQSPFSNDISNGDGFLFYPPKDNTVGFNPCIPESNRLVPSLRLELLREGLEDYAYLWLLNNGKPQINLENRMDRLAKRFIESRTSYNRVPTALESIRLEAGLRLHKDHFYYMPLIYR